MIVTTRNSHYQVDEANKRIRRVWGESDTTPRFTPEGEWKPYEHITPIETFLSITVTWPDDPSGELDPYTQTSVVLAIAKEQTDG